MIETYAVYDTFQFSINFLLFQSVFKRTGEVRKLSRKRRQVFYWMGKILIMTDSVCQFIFLNFQEK